VEFRVTVGLGQDSVEVATLEGRAAALQQHVAALPDGGGAVVVVDLVKAAAQLVVNVDAGDALAAAAQALQLADEGLQAAGLDAPGSVVTVEAEAVPHRRRTRSCGRTPPTAHPDTGDAAGITQARQPADRPRARGRPASSTPCNPAV